MKSLLPILFLCGCSTTSVHIPLDPQPGTVQVIEARPTMFSTITVAIGYNNDGQVIGFTGAEGMPIMNIPTALLSAGSTIGAAVLLGNKIKGAAGAIPKDVTVNGEITTTIQDFGDDTPGGDLLDELLDIIGE